MSMIFTDWLVFAGFFVLLGITLYRLYMLINYFTSDNDEYQDKGKTWTLFIASIFFWFLVLLVTLIDTTSIVYSVLNRVGTLLLSLNVLMLIINVLLMFTGFSGDKVSYKNGSSWLKRL